MWPSGPVSLHRVFMYASSCSSNSKKKIKSREMVGTEIESEPEHGKELRIIVWQIQEHYKKKNCNKNKKKWNRLQLKPIQKPMLKLVLTLRNNTKI